jgi:preprotein translocase subunit SecA
MSMGGLYVLGTERHDSRRIDDQLRGRSGRQGDPGETRFYLSLEDELLQRFRINWIKAFLNTLHVAADQPIENPRLSAAVEAAQAEAEMIGFEERKQVLKYDDVLDGQRRTVYATRHALLAGDDIHEQVRSMIRHLVDDLVSNARVHGEDESDTDHLWTCLEEFYPIGLDRAEVDHMVNSRRARHELVDRIVADTDRILTTREADLGHDGLRDLERRTILETLDRHWRDHLYEMDGLRDAVQWRAVAGRDPVVEFTAEAIALFNEMSADIEADVVHAVLVGPSLG